MDNTEGLVYARERHMLQEQFYKEDGFYMMYKIIARIKTLTPAEKLVITVILSFEEQGLEFRMSTSMLSYETGLSVSTITRVIKDLKERNIIRTFKKFDINTGFCVGRIVRLHRGKISKESTQSNETYRYEETTNSEE